MKTYEVPLLAAQAQSFSVSLNQLDYNLRVLWNVAANCWVLDIANSDDTPLVSGIPLVTGVDLLSQYAYLGIGGSLFALTDVDTDAVPTYENLGQSSHLYFVVS